MPAAYKLMRRGVRRLFDSRLITPDDRLEWEEYLAWRRIGRWQRVTLPDGSVVDQWIGNVPDPVDPEPPPPARQFNFVQAARAQEQRRIEKLARTDPQRALLIKAGLRRE